MNQYLDWKRGILELGFRGRGVELERTDKQIIKRKRTSRLTYNHWQNILEKV